MNRLPALRPKEMVAVLKRAGFQEHHQKGSHLILRHPTLKGRVIVPMHPKDLPRGTMKAIIKSAELKEDQFLELLK